MPPKFRGKRGAGGVMTRFVAFCSVTAVLEPGQSEQRVSTGIDALDAVLGGLYWGDNVVWQLDAAPVEPFYGAIAALSETFETRAFIALGSDADTFEAYGLSLIHIFPWGVRGVGSRGERLVRARRWRGRGSGCERSRRRRLGGPPVAVLWPR